MDDPRSELPRTYRISLSTRVAMVAILSVLLIGLAILIRMLHAERPLDSVVYWVSGLWVIVAVGGGLEARQLFAWRLILTEDAIEVYNVFPARARRMRRDEIAGWYVRTIGRYNERRLWIVPKAAGQRPMEVNLEFGRDATFRDWIIAFPDLESENAGVAPLPAGTLSPEESAAVTRLTGDALRERRRKSD